MGVPQGDKKFMGMVLVLISLSIFVFFTKGLYSELVMTRDSHNENTKAYADMVLALDTLSTKSKELKVIEKKNKLEGKTNSEIKKYLKELNEDDIIQEIYGFASDYSTHGRMKILSLNMTEGAKNELGFNEAGITVNARVANEKVMIDFLDFVIDNPNYRFFITNFSIPKNTETAFNIKVPITFFYKDLQTK